MQRYSRLCSRSRLCRGSFSLRSHVRICQLPHARTIFHPSAMSPAEDCWVNRVSTTSRSLQMCLSFLLPHFALVVRLKKLSSHPSDVGYVVHFCPCKSTNAAIPPETLGGSVGHSGSLSLGKWMLNSTFLFLYIMASYGNMMAFVSLVCG